MNEVDQEKADFYKNRLIETSREKGFCEDEIMKILSDYCKGCNKIRRCWCENFSSMCLRNCICINRDERQIPFGS